MSTLRATEIFSNSILTLIAVESVDFRHGKANTGCHLYGSIEPIAVVVCSPEGTYAFDMKAEPANFDQLRQDVPELDVIVARLNKAQS